MTEEEACNYIKGRIEQHRNGDRSHKWSPEDLLIRHQLILKWLGEGTPRIDVARNIMNVWNVCDSNARQYVTDALKYLTEATDDYRDYVRQTQVSKIEKMIEACKTAGKMKEAAMFQEQLNKIYGIYTENKKVEVKSETPIIVSFDN